MYLSKLSIEQKHIFLDLEIHMSKIDGNFSAEEKQIIDAHCLEMHIDNNGYKNEMSLSEVIEHLKSDFNAKEKHIVFLELAATVWADNVYHETEKDLIESLSDKLSITEKEIDIAFSLVNQLKEAYKGCADFVGE